MYKVLGLKHDAEEWRKTLESMPSSQQDVYFTPEYYALHEKNGDGESCCFVYEEKGDELAIPAEASQSMPAQRVLYPFLLNNVSVLGYEIGGGTAIFKAHTAIMVL